MASEYISKILGISKQKLTTLLTTTVVRVGGEQVIKPSTLEQAEEQRDAIAQNMYHRLFNWLVQKFNGILRLEEPTVSTISVLDMCGFDDEGIGGLGKLYTNVANEQLHFFFLSHIFTAEMKDNEGEVST